jgi:hypothetical protein
MGAKLSWGGTRWLQSSYSLLYLVVGAGLSFGIEDAFSLHDMQAVQKMVCFNDDVGVMEPSSVRYTW